VLAAIEVAQREDFAAIFLLKVCIGNGCRKKKRSDCEKEADKKKSATESDLGHVTRVAAPSNKNAEAEASALITSDQYSTIVITSEARDLFSFAAPTLSQLKIPVNAPESRLLAPKSSRS
jgi:hypothetical protein